MVRFNYQEGKGWDPINQFNSATFLYLSQARTYIFNIMGRGIFLCTMIGESWFLRFVGVGRIVDYHRLKSFLVPSH